MAHHVSDLSTMQAYEQGYYANASGDSKEENPHSEKTQAIEYYAWAGGWNDCDLGYKLDLTVFEG